MNSYNSLVNYVKHNRHNSTFDANKLRARLNVSPSEFSAVIVRAVKNNMIEKIGLVPSTVPSHNKRAVGVYRRTINSYVGYQELVKSNPEYTAGFVV